VDAHAAAHPGIHPDEPLRLNLLDIDGVRASRIARWQVRPVWWVRWRMIGKATPRTSNPLSAPRLRLKIFKPTGTARLRIAS